MLICKVTGDYICQINVVEYYTSSNTPSEM